MKSFLLVSGCLLAFCAIGLAVPWLATWYDEYYSSVERRIQYHYHYGYPVFVKCPPCEEYALPTTTTLPRREK